MALISTLDPLFPTTRGPVLLLPPEDPRDEGDPPSGPGWDPHDGIIYIGNVGRDVIHGTERGDVMWARNGHDELFGHHGNDYIYGEDGDDWIYGDSWAGSGEFGDDKLSGGSGIDNIFGGDGNDLIYGGNGNDYLSGGAGQDQFVLGTDQGWDEIKDFQHGDVIRFTDVTYSYSDFWGAHNKPVIGWDINFNQGTVIRCDDGRTVFLKGFDPSQFKGAVVDGHYEWTLA
jgi:hypothetical protein